MRGVQDGGPARVGEESASLSPVSPSIQSAVSCAPKTVDRKPPTRPVGCEAGGGNPVPAFRLPVTGFGKQVDRERSAGDRELRTVCVSKSTDGDTGERLALTFGQSGVDSRRLPNVAGWIDV